MSKREEKESTLGVADVIKKVVSIGVGAAFMTEDAVRNMLADLPLPKDIISGLVQNAKGAKEDFTKSIREELRGHLSRLDMAKLVEEIVSRYDLEINASVKFKKKDQTPPDADA
jgi:hypothetical protein